MSRGAGRGRGWLNLSKTSPEQMPGTVVGCENPQIPTDSDYFSDVPSASPEVLKLVDMVNSFSPSDDGIFYNRKLKNLREYWTAMCSTPEDFIQSMTYLCDMAFQDLDFGLRLTLMLSGRSVNDYKIHGECPMKFFINRLQNIFEDSDLHIRDKKTYRNFVQIFGEFCYGRIGLSSCKLMKRAMPTCFEKLLSSKSQADLSLLAKQFYMLGAHFDTPTIYAGPNAKPTKIIPDFLLKVRSTLTLENSLSRECKLWLLLIMDLYNYNFGLALPADVAKFYSDQLGAEAWNNFIGPNRPIAINPRTDILDDVPNHVNLLKISQPITIDISEKAGRPILGAGARSSNNSSASDVPVDNVHTRGERKPLRKPKARLGWEHDDRFENDYS